MIPERAWRHVWLWSGKWVYRRCSEPILRDAAQPPANAEAASARPADRMPEEASR